MTTTLPQSGTGHTWTPEINFVSDVVARLAALWPQHFRGEQGEAWGLEYGRLLKGFTGHELTLAWSDVMDHWEKQSPPKPAAFRNAAKQYQIKKPAGGRTINWPWINARAKELVGNVQKNTKMDGWDDMRKIRARMHWDRLADVQAQFEDMGHEDPIAATARYYGLDERTMWEPGR